MAVRSGAAAAFGMFGMLGMFGIGAAPAAGNARSVASAFGMTPPCAFATRPVTVEVCAVATDATQSSITPIAQATRHLSIEDTSKKVLS
jgi:hypothetical protein